MFSGFSNILRMTGNVVGSPFSARSTSFRNASVVVGTALALGCGGCVCDVTDTAFSPLAPVVLVVSCRHKCCAYQKLGELVEFRHGGVLSLDCSTFSALCLAHVAFCLASHVSELCCYFGDFAAADVLADNPTIFATALPVVFVFLVPAHLYYTCTSAPLRKMCESGVHRCLSSRPRRPRSKAWVFWKSFTALPNSVTYNSWVSTPGLLAQSCARISCLFASKTTL
jgi:hypothetical protein